MIGEAVYMRATHPGSPFFVDSRSLMAHAEESWDPEPDCPIGWASNKSVVWTYMQPTACIMRTHGWKIHVTASLLVVVGLYNRMRSGDTLISVP